MKTVDDKGTVDEKGAAPAPALLARAADAVEAGIAAGTARVASVATTRPWLTIASTLTISLACASGITLMKYPRPSVIPARWSWHNMFLSRRRHQQSNAAKNQRRRRPT